ncbi:MAG: hypothetical protein ACYCS7_02440 [Acidimicrobiales bacterium]
MEDFNLTPVLARAHYEQMARCFSDYGHMALQPQAQVQGGLLTVEDLA